MSKIIHEIVKQYRGLRVNDTDDKYRKGYNMFNNFILKELKKKFKFNWCKSTRNKWVFNISNMTYDECFDNYFIVTSDFDDISIRAILPAIKDSKEKQRLKKELFEFLNKEYDNK